ncbi:MAG: hypothetical protein O3B86_08770, partial [Planctomycetota bacterium]|nr:hypothetical protein [Planctomycetota bacterium]
VAILDSEVDNASTDENLAAEDETEGDFGSGVDQDTSTEEEEKAEDEGGQPDDLQENTAQQPEVLEAIVDKPAKAAISKSRTEGAEGSQPPRLSSSLKILLASQGVEIGGTRKTSDGTSKIKLANDPTAKEPDYEPDRAYPNEPLINLLSFKSINPLYGMFLLDVLPFASGPERVQALESVLVFPGAVSRNLRIPRPDVMPLSPFVTDFLNPELLQRGLATITELGGTKQDDDENDERGGYREPEEWVRPLNFPEKLLRLFRSEYPGVSDVPMTDVWAAGELLNFGGDFNKLVTSRKIAKQEGILFRHVLRFILMCEEFLPHIDKDSIWHGELQSISYQLTESCRHVDPHSTDMMIESARAVDPLLAETPTERHA